MTDFSEAAWLWATKGEALVIRHDADQVEGLAPDRNAIWARIGTADFLTEDEKREAVGYGRRA